MNKKIIFTLIFMCSLQIQSSIDRQRDRRPIKKRTLVQDLCIPAGSLMLCWRAIDIFNTMPEGFQNRVYKGFARVDRFASKRNFILADLMQVYVRLAFFFFPICGGAKIGYDLSERFGK